MKNGGREAAFLFLETTGSRRTSNAEQALRESGRVRVAPRLLLILLAACTPDVPPAEPAAPTPASPPPSRARSSATVSGRVIGAGGSPVAHAAVLVHPADAKCRALPDGATEARTDESGEYQVTIEVPVGPASRGCAVVEARSGGTGGSASAPALFTFSEADRRPVRVDVRLVRPRAMTVAEGERLVRALADAINDSTGTVDPELALHVQQGSEALRVALGQYRALFGRIESIRPLPPDWHAFPFEILGANGRTGRVTVEQGDLNRLRSPLLDYGARSGRFVTAYIRAIASGDAERFAMLLNPDDVDFPVDRAREIIASYHRRYADLGAIRAEFAGNDEKQHTITWRLRGQTPTGQPVTEDLVLRYGDGLIGVVGL